eukprot:1222871-Prymnesium_polylepis.2
MSTESLVRRKYPRLIGTFERAVPTLWQSEGQLAAGRYPLHTEQLALQCTRSQVPGIQRSQPGARVEALNSPMEHGSSDEVPSRLKKPGCAGVHSLCLVRLVAFEK